MRKDSAKSMQCKSARRPFRPLSAPRLGHTQAIMPARPLQSSLKRDIHSFTRTLIENNDPFVPVCSCLQKPAGISPAGKYMVLTCIDDRPINKSSERRWQLSL